MPLFTHKQLVGFKYAKNKYCYKTANNQQITPHTVRFSLGFHHFPAAITL